MAIPSQDVLKQLLGFSSMHCINTAVQQLLSDPLLVFAPGLLDVFQASTPPSLSYFKSQPTYVSKCWAVYLIILEKLDSRPKIYIVLVHIQLVV
jgi:hypothetical protein